MSTAPEDDRLPGTAQAILDAAVDLFVGRNYEGASMREIAAAVGVTPASLYNHYRSKEDILWEIVQRSWRALSDAQMSSASSASGTVEQFVSFVDAHSRFHAMHPRLAGIANRQLQSLESRRYRTVMERRRDYAGRLQTIVSAGVAEGVFTVPHVPVAAFALLDVGMGLTRWFDPSKELSVDEVCTAHVELALRAVHYTGDRQRLSSHLGDRDGRGATAAGPAASGTQVEGPGRTPGSP
ncbi:TetR/AcrR family transcriptional regulator [Blastococcus sp. SYSU DS0973]